MHGVQTATGHVSLMTVSAATAGVRCNPSALTAVTIYRKIPGIALNAASFAGEGAKG